MASTTILRSPPATRARKRKIGESVDNPVNLDSPQKSKRKAKGKAKAENRIPIDLTADDNDGQHSGLMLAPKVADDAVLNKGKKRAKVGEGQAVEKRLKKFRARPPNSYHDILSRAMNQRMFVVDRVRGGTVECPEETLTIAGTTGNLYTVKIDKVPSCDCPHAQKGNQCKHILYALIRVLHAPDDLQYQLAFLSSELRTIFAQAPPIPSADASSSDGKRKKIEEGDDCPICCMPFDEATEEIVYCRAACGNNVHKECFEQWAATRKDSSTGVTCPFCRTPWQGDEELVKRLAKTGTRNEEGYVNVAGELGLSGRRDYSTYHSFWVRREARRGVDVGDAYYDYDFD